MDIEVLTLEEAEEAAFITRLVLSDIDDFRSLRSHYALIELFDFFLFLSWEVLWHVFNLQRTIAKVPLFIASAEIEFPFRLVLRTIPIGL